MCVIIFFITNKSECVTLYCTVHHVTQVFLEGRKQEQARDQQNAKMLSDEVSQIQEVSASPSLLSYLLPTPMSPSFYHSSSIPSLLPPSSLSLLAPSLLAAPV